MNRRMFLKYGAAGTTLLALGGLTLGLQNTRLRNGGQELNVLNPAEFSILSAIADRLLPSNSPFPAASEILVPQHIDALLAAAHPGLVTEIKLVLSIIENAATNAILEQHWKPFTQSTMAQQDALLESWKNSSLSFRRTSFKALNSLCAAVYYAQPEIHPLVGYPGPPAILQEVVQNAAHQLEKTP